MPRSASHTPIFQTFFDYRQGMRKKQAWGNCELEMLSFQASKVPYDLALDIIDDAGDADCLLMLIVREDMYSKQDAEVLLRSYGQLVRAFAESPEVSFAEPDMFEAAEVERSLTFGRGLLFFLCSSTHPGAPFPDGSGSSPVHSSLRTVRVMLRQTRLMIISRRIPAVPMGREDRH